MTDAPPIITNEDAAIDSAFFGLHAGRTCYASAHHSGWVLVVRQIVAQREPPVMLRVWGRLERVPDNDANCLALWERCALCALTPHWHGCATFHIALPRTAARRGATHRHAAPGGMGRPCARDAACWYSASV